MPKDHQPHWFSVVKAIDHADVSVSAWEAEFLESLLKQRPETLTPKRQAVLDAMADKYLDGREGV